MEAQNEITLCSNKYSIQFVSILRNSMFEKDFYKPKFSIPKRPVSMLSGIEINAHVEIIDNSKRNTM